MKRSSALVIAGLLCWLAVGAHAGDSFALRAKRVYPVTLEQPGPISNAVIVVRDGRIVAIGPDVPIPADLPFLDLGDEVVCPGFVLASAELSREVAPDQSVSGYYRAADAFDPYGDYKLPLMTGVTTVGLDPDGRRLVAGVGAVARLGGPPESRLLKPLGDLSINLGVFNPPPLIERPFYASADEKIEPGARQRPESRLGQLLELEERIASAAGLLAGQRKGDFDAHALSFAQAWTSGARLRIQARQAADIGAALSFIRKHKRAAVLEGLTQSDALTQALADSGAPLILRVESRYDAPDASLGDGPDALEADLETAARLAKALGGAAAQRLALTGREGDGTVDPQMIGALAMRGGASREVALAALTRVPAEILGVSDRLGSLAVGKSADLVALSADPFDTQARVRRTIIAGQTVYAAPASEAVVIRAGTVWTGAGAPIQDGALLIQEGKIKAIGQRVATPLGAKVIDAGPGAFVTPGFIDIHGHLGLEGDTTAATPDLAMHEAVGVATRSFRRVARAGVTSVLLSAYESAKGGSRVAAIKTFGAGRERMVTQELAGVKFSLRDEDTLLGVEAIGAALEAGKKYVEKWKKYEEELAKWKQDQAAGIKTDKPATTPVETFERKEADPITGSWDITVSGGPIPEPQHGTMLLRLTGTMIEGRVMAPGETEEVTVTGSLDGKNVTLEVDADTPLGRPQIKATLDREDHMQGNVLLGSFMVDFEAARTDKSAVEFRVQRKRGRGKDGRPEPPKVEENLEPLRPLLAGKIPAIVHAANAAQARAAIKLLVDDNKIPVVLLAPPDILDIAGDLATRREQVAVAPPPQVITRRDNRRQNLAAELAQRGVTLAFQSDAEDGARSLPLMALFAAREGLGGDAALRALTVDAAKAARLESRIGTLEVGKDGDVLIFSGHPFDGGSRLERVLVGGLEPREPESRP